MSLEGNWLLITQVEAYYHEEKVDDVAQNDSHFSYADKLQINFEKCEMGRGLWYELRFRYKKLEFIATGGINGNNNSSKPVDAFLGVAVPPSVSQDTGLLWFSPLHSADSSACLRMLRNYKRRDSLKQWCFKSSFFLSKNFSTPGQLKLYKTEPAGYVAICSKLLYFCIYGQLSLTDMVQLEDS